MATALLLKLYPNAAGWRRPAQGRLNNSAMPKILQHHGWGGEDWNFNTDMDVQGHLYGHLWPVRRFTKPPPYNIAFCVRLGSQREWHLAGFYLSAVLVERAPNLPSSIAKKRGEHLSEMQKSSDLGGKYASMTKGQLTRELQNSFPEANLIKVQKGDVIALEDPILIAAPLPTPSHDHFSLPTYVDMKALKGLLSLAGHRALGNKQRKESAELLDAADENDGFPEGRERYRLHRYKERNTTEIRRLKEQRRQSRGFLDCDACGFIFLSVYGDLGEGYIEAHHTVPVSSLTSSSITRAADIALVCANCHRMLHRRRPWLTMKNLKKLLNSEA